MFACGVIMADVTISSAEGIIARIDNDSSGTEARFEVQHKLTTGAWEVVFTVEETKFVTVYNAWFRDGTHVFNNIDSGGTTLVEFKSGGTVKASITKLGIGVFPRVKLPVRTTSPSGVVNGIAGQLLLYNNGTDSLLYICEGGTVWVAVT